MATIKSEKIMEKYELLKGGLTVRVVEGADALAHDLTKSNEGCLPASHFLMQLSTMGGKNGFKFDKKKMTTDDIMYVSFTVSKTKKAKEEYEKIVSEKARLVKDIENKKLDIAKKKEEIKESVALSKTVKGKGSAKRKEELQKERNAKRVEIKEYEDNIQSLRKQYGYKVKEGNELTQLKEIRNKLYKEGFDIITYEYGDKMQEKIKEELVKIAKEVKEANKDKKKSEIEELIKQAKARFFKNELPSWREIYSEDVVEVIKHYKRYVPTTAKSRLGKSMFVLNRETANGKVRREGLLDRMEKEMNCGIIATARELAKQGIKVPAVEIDSYCSLNQSAIVNDDDGGYVQITSKEMVIFRDIESLVSMGMNEFTYDEKDGIKIVKNPHNKSTNVLFDGQALADTSVFGDRKTTSILLRQDLFKANAIKCRMQEYIKNMCEERGLDYETTRVKDLVKSSNKDMAKRILLGGDNLVKNIKLLTTDNATKVIKFKGMLGCKSDADVIALWCKKCLDKCEGMLSIVKVEHGSHLGYKVKNASYQYMGSMNFGSTTEEVEKAFEEICTDSIEYVTAIRKYDDKQLEFIKRRSEDKMNVTAQRIYDTIQWNKDYLYSPEVKQFIHNETSTMINGYKTGGVRLTGDYLIISGNSDMMLRFLTGDIWMKDGYLDATKTKNELMDSYNKLNKVEENKGVMVYATMFDYGEELVCMRSPHSSEANIAYCVNVYDKKDENNFMKKYFPIGENVIIVDFTERPAEDIWGGSDMDSDILFTTSNKKIVENCKKNTWTKAYPTVNLSGNSKNKYYYIPEELCKKDLATQEVNIGAVANAVCFCQAQYQDLRLVLNDGEKYVKGLVEKINKLKENYDKLAKEIAEDEYTEGTLKKKNAELKKIKNEIIEKVCDRNRRMIILNDKKTYESMRDNLRNEIIPTLDIMQGAAIDFAKRTPEYDLKKELKKITGADDKFIKMAQINAKDNMTVEDVIANTDMITKLYVLTEKKVEDGEEVTNEYRVYNTINREGLDNVHSVSGSIARPEFFLLVSKQKSDSSKVSRANYYQTSCDMDILMRTCDKLLAESGIRNGKVSKLEDIVRETVNNKIKKDKIEEVIKGAEKLFVLETAKRKELNSNQIEKKDFFKDIDREFEKFYTDMGKLSQDTTTHLVKLSLGLVNTVKGERAQTVKGKILNALYKASKKKYLSSFVQSMEEEKRQTA